MMPACRRAIEERAERTGRAILRILIIISAIVVAIIAVVRFVKSKLSGLMDPPPRIHLVPDRKAPGCSRKDMERYKPFLESHGFDEIGVFRVPEIAGLVLTAYTQPYQMVSAVVYRHPFVGCFVDLFSENEHERSLTVTNTPYGEELDYPPGREKLFDKSMAMPDMYDHLLRHRPSGPHRRIDASNFVAEFETAYAKEMDWRVDRGGATEEEVRRSAEIMGVTSEEAIQKTTQKIQEQYAKKQTIHSRD